MGRRWYEDGKLLAKKNTFTDFVASARHLVKSGWTASERLVARGGSAGGLLMGAVANLAPEAFAGIVAEVPFVDALNSILDPSLPLTVTEWEEWGNPIEDAEVYAYMKSYTPYENVTKRAVSGDPGGDQPERHPGAVSRAGQVDRPAAGDRAGDRPFLLKTEMGAGHGGPSGRYDLWRDQAFVMAFVIEALGAPHHPV